MNANIEIQLNAMLANKNGIIEAVNEIANDEHFLSTSAGLEDIPTALRSLTTVGDSLYFSTDDTSAYRKKVPSRAQPMTQLISVGGMTRVDKSPNLLDFMTSNYRYITAPPNWYNTLGVTIPAGTYRVSFDVSHMDGEFADGDGAGVYAYYGTSV